MKNLGKKKMLLAISILAFIQIFFLYPIKDKILFLTLSQTANFGLFQTERICRRQLEI